MCGCGEVIFRRSKDRKIRYYKNGHSNKGKKTKIVRRGPEHNNWKGGRKKTEDYWELWMPDYFSAKKNGYVLEHVYFFQEYHQCCILKWGVVHHIIPVSKDYCNNMPWNLMGMTKGRHIALHKTGVISYQKDMTNRFCKYCGGKTYITPSGHKQWYGDEINGFRCRKCDSKIRRSRGC